MCPETFTKDQKNKFKELRKGETEQSIIKFVKEFIDKTPSGSDFETFLNYVTKSDEAFTDFVRLVDCFDRESKSFRLMHNSIIWGFENHHTKYKQYYRKVVGRQDNKESRLLKKKDVNLSTIASDNLILKGDE